MQTGTMIKIRMDHRSSKKLIPQNIIFLINKINIMKIILNDIEFSLPHVSFKVGINLFCVGKDSLCSLHF
jgi:membrane protein required for beta-lactamase induction